MSTEPVDDQFAFVQDEPPRLTAGRKRSRASVLVRIWVALLFVTLDLAILACILHLLRIVAIPGLPPMGAETGVAQTNDQAPQARPWSANIAPAVVSKAVRPRRQASSSGTKTAHAPAPKANDPPAANDLTAEEVLESEGLKKVDAGYVFNDEADLQKRLEKSRALFKQTKAAFDQLKEAARDFNMLNRAIGTRDAERTDLEAAIAGQQEFVNRMPRVTNLDKAAHEEANGALSVARARLTELRRQLEHGRRELPGVTQRKNQALRAYKGKESEFLSDARLLQRTFESRIEEYSTLTSDPKIKKALETVGRASGKSFQLSPSKELRSGLDELKNCVKTVENTEVPEM